MWTVDILLKYLHGADFQNILGMVLLIFLCQTFLFVCTFIHSGRLQLVDIQFSEWHFDSFADKGVSELHHWLVPAQAGSSSSGWHLAQAGILKSCIYCISALFKNCRASCYLLLNSSACHSACMSVGPFNRTQFIVQNVLNPEVLRLFILHAQYLCFLTLKPYPSIRALLYTRCSLKCLTAPTHWGLLSFLY